MTIITKFQEDIQKGYKTKHDFFVLGTGILDEDPVSGASVNIPLKTLNRHGLIAGATGTGKTKTLQVIAEQLSLKGIPSVLMDLKGDLSGLAMPGSLNDHITWRSSVIGVDYNPEGLPVELLTISQEKGARMKATVTEFGPILMSQILDLNDTQQGIMALVFRYCDLQHLPLLDLNDLRKVLQYIVNEGKEEIKKEYGTISSSSVNTILRKIIALEQEGAGDFFGETSFDVNDFLRVEGGKGLISIIRLTDIQNRPKLFSTFMLSILSEIYESFPEQGDQDKPKLCLFIDEAHLVFDNASKELIEKIETIVKLIRSKGVGVFFCTQSPTDIPESVLGQLGLKVQHSLRAFTAKDRKSISKTAENYPISDFYDTKQVLTMMGIGEALVTALNEKGMPTPLVRTLMRAPISRMDILSKSEIEEIVAQSKIAAKYNMDIDRESAMEMLEEKINRSKAVMEKMEKAQVESKSKPSKRVEDEENIFEELSKNTMVRQIGRTIFRELARSILGTLSGKRR